MDDRTTGMTADRAAERRTAEIRQEIEDTREDLSETIEAIQEKLRPANVVAGATDRVKSATTEKVRHMRHTASEMADRQNLLPAALIGIGTAWLLMNRSSRPRTAYWEHDEPAGSWRGAAEREGSGAYGAVGTQGTATERVSAMAGRTSERAGELADSARTAVRETSRRAQNHLQRAIHENPLAVGAAAAILGAAVGLALPETERENQWMGEARESVLDRAQDLAREAKEKVKQAASDAVGSTLTGSSNA